MKTRRIATVLAAVLALAGGVVWAAAPCDPPARWDREFETHGPATYRGMAAVNHGGYVTTLTTVSGECFDYYEVDDTHNPLFPPYVFEISEPMIIDYEADANVLSVTVFLGSAVLDEDQRPCLSCWDLNGHYRAVCGYQGVGLGGYHDLIISVPHSTSTGSPLVPIDYCVITPDGDNLFGVLVKDPPHVAVRGKASERAGHDR